MGAGLPRNRVLIVLTLNLCSFERCGCIIEYIISFSSESSVYPALAKRKAYNPMFGIGVPELMLILVLALIIFGPGKLPDVGKAVGKALGEFRNASREIETEIKK
jgi:sec-independent protein translocase protein TatA